MLLTVCCILLASEAVQGGAFSKGASYNLGTFGGELTTAVKVIRVTNTVAVPVPYPFPITKHVPVPVSVPKPIPYAVPQPVPVEVTKPVVIAQPVPFEIPKPYSVPQHHTTFPLSLPGYLTAPQYQGNRANDYQAYVTYGSAGGGDYDQAQYQGNRATDYQAYVTYGSGGGGDYDHAQYQGNRATDSQAYVTYGSGGGGDYSAPVYGHDQAQQEYNYEGTQGVYRATNQEGQVYSTTNLPAGATGYGNSAGLSHGQNFESTNSVEEHPVAGHGNGY